MSWNADGQMTGMTGPSSATRSFEYDALERRVTRTANGTTTLFTRTVGENGGAVLVESVGSSVTSEYVYGNGLVGKSGEANLYDGVGSTRQVTGSSGSVSSSSLSDAFGNTVASSGSVGAYKFAATSGYRDDGDGGLVHIAARYYDPLTGQFVSRDTHLDQKPYHYCEGDPVNSLDPSGHNPLTEWAIAAFTGLPVIGQIIVVDVGVYFGVKSGVGIWEHWNEIIVNAETELKIGNMITDWGKVPEWPGAGKQRKMAGASLAALIFVEAQRKGK